MEKDLSVILNRKAMTDLTLPAAGKKAGMRRPVHRMPRTDMTPMVDLAFLLISFFVITTQMQQPTAMSLAMPKDGPAQPVGATESLTLLLNGDRQLYWYEGAAAEALQSGKLQPVENGVKGLRDILVKKQKALDNFKGRDRLMVLVKPGDKARYYLLIDVLDELKIMGVSRFAVTDPMTAETEFLGK